MSKFCPGCGQAMADQQRFCGACGREVAAAATEPVPEPVVETAPESDALYWSAEFALVTSRFFLRDIFKFLGLTFGVLAGISLLMSVAADTDLQDALALLPLWGMAVLGLGLLVLVVSMVVLGNRAGAIYRVDEDGVAMLSRSKAQPLNEISQWLGLLSGNGQLWASGLLAEAQEKVYMRWRSVHGFRLYPSEGVIELDDSFHMALRIYCPPEVYPKILARLQTLPVPVTGKGRGWLAIVGWLLLTVVATLLGLCWEPKVNDVGFMVVLAGMFVFMAGLLPGALHRGLGLFGLLSGLCALAHRGYHLFSPTVWNRDFEFWPAAFATLGCAMLVALALYQMFRQERPGQEMVLFDQDLQE
ncbi:MAG: zinc ribbon domain-containing protein [Vulcanimicrobiota bacterium]